MSKVKVSPVYGTHDEYPPALYGMEKEHVAVANVGALHKYLLEHKAYIDMTGNNTNHPNEVLGQTLYTDPVGCAWCMRGKSSSTIGQITILRKMICTDQ